MKQSLFIVLILVSLVLPLACSDNNNNPTKPPVSSGSGGTQPAPTISGGGITLSGVLTPTPTFINNYGASTSPNGIYYDGTSNVIYVMEGSPGITLFPSYSINTANGVLSIPPYGPPSAGFGGNELATGCPPVPPGVPGPQTPTPVPWSAPSTIIAQLPMGVAFTKGGGGGGLFPKGWWGILDSSPGGSAVLYEGGWLNNYYCSTGFVCPSWNTGYDAYAYKSPRALVADSQGNFFVADTGNDYVDEMGPGGWQNGGVPATAWEHRWNGSTAKFPFRQPVALAIDAYDNLFVGDSGYTPSVVAEYANGGTYLVGQWVLTTGCVINGLAVDSLNPNGFFVDGNANYPGEDIYVSDTANGGQVEEYQITGNYTASEVRTWGVPVGSVSPNGYHEYLPFMPSCIALIQVPGTPPGAPTQIVVGDQDNNLIQVFGP